MPWQSVGWALSACVAGVWRSIPRSLRVVLHPLLRQVGEGKAASGEIKIANRVFLLHLLPLQDSAVGRFVGMGIAEDITELASGRELLQAAHDLLEARVRERTAELEFQKALLVARVMHRWMAFWSSRTTRRSSFTTGDLKSCGN